MKLEIRRLATIAIVILSLGSAAHSSSLLAQGRHEKREQKLEESGRAKSVEGGATFQVDLSYETAYEAALNYLKRHDYTIDSASKETGQIITAITVKGGWSQTGTRVYVTLFKDNGAQTTIKVAVSEQKRKKLLQTEPWGDPKVKADKSEQLADEMKASIK